MRNSSYPIFYRNLTGEKIVFLALLTEKSTQSHNWVSICMWLPIYCVCVAGGGGKVSMLCCFQQMFLDLVTTSLTHVHCSEPEAWKTYNGEMGNKAQSRVCIQLNLRELLALATQSIARLITVLSHRSVNSEWTGFAGWKKDEYMVSRHTRLVTSWVDVRFVKGSFIHCLSEKQFPQKRIVCAN